MTTTLTRRQRQLLDYLTNYASVNGHAPSLEEMATALGVKAISTVDEHLRHLADKGAIVRYRDVPRGIVILADPCPVCGRARGPAGEQQENPE